MKPLVDKKVLDSSDGLLYCTAPSRPCRAVMYRAALGRALSIVQLVCGILVASSSFVMIFTIGIDLELNGLKLGSTFIMAGLLGMAASKYKSYSLIIPSMVMSILATISAIPMAFVLLFKSAAISVTDSRYMPVGSSNALVAGLLLLSAVLFIAESTAAVWVSVLSGNIVCPCRGTDRGGEGKVYTNYASGHSLPYGIIQIIMAALAFVLGIASLVMSAQDFPAYRLLTFYITASIFYLPAGILGVVTAYRRTLPLIVSHMVLCIFAALFAGFHLLIAFLMVFFNNSRTASYYPIDTQWSNGARMTVEVLLLIIGVLEFVIAILSSVLCCRVTCCAPSQGQPRVYADYKTGQSRAIGAIQIVFGILTVILVIGYAFNGSLLWSTAFVPLPCGILTIITGSFGIKAANTKARSKIITHWILSLMTVLYAISLIGYSLQILTSVSRLGRRYGEPLYYPEDAPLSLQRVPYGDPLLLPFHGINISLAVVEIALALWAAAVSYLASRADVYSRQAEQSGRSGEKLSPTHC